mgnify:CR=1 FL=1
MSKKIYTVLEAANEKGVSRQWMYILLDKGKIEEATSQQLREAGIDVEFIPIRRRFITEEALNNYIKRSKNT